MNITDIIARELAGLVFAAGVSAEDGGERAARLVCERLKLEGCKVSIYETSSPESCPMSLWLRKACNLPAHAGEHNYPIVLMGVTNVVLLLGREANGSVRSQLIPLPPALIAAVALIGERRVAALIEMPEAA